MSTQSFEIKNRWSGSVIFTAEIECGEDASYGIKPGLAVRAAYKSGADLRDADLRDAVLRDVYLRDAVLRGAVLSGAVLRGSVLRGSVLSGAVLSDACPVKIKNIHQRVYAAASVPDALDMDAWHANDGFCGTTHCRAGWVVHLAGDAGRALEWAMGTSAAATMIYLASDPKIEKIPDFYCSNEAALEDMKRLAEAEASKSVVTP